METQCSAIHTSLLLTSVLERSIGDVCDKLNKNVHFYCAQLFITTPEQLYCKELIVGLSSSRKGTMPSYVERSLGKARSDRSIWRSCSKKFLHLCTIHKVHFFYVLMYFLNPGYVFMYHCGGGCHERNIRHDPSFPVTESDASLVPLWLFLISFFSHKRIFFILHMPFCLK